jgi:hypothetical protein
MGMNLEAYYGVFVVRHQTKQRVAMLIAAPDQDRELPILSSCTAIRLAELNTDHFLDDLA